MSSFKQPELLYSHDALAPVISAATIDLHYGAHTKAYFDNLNKLVENSDFVGASIDKIICNAQGPLFNNAAQAWNHIFYFNSFSPAGGGEPEGNLANVIKKQFGSFEDFKAQFNDAAMKIFGSGWIWLARDFEGRLFIVPKPNAGNPMTEGMTPLLTFDVWEHAYYLDYQNRRLEHLNALWKIIDWKSIENRY